MPIPHGLNALNEFVLTVLNSSRVAKSKPLSALIIGLPDTGKTEVVMQASKMKRVSVQTDITGFGLATLLPKIQNKEIRTIIIPDLARITAGRGKSTQNLIAALNSLIEEGVLNINTFNTRFVSEEPVQCNMIAALTISSFDEDKDSWAGLGFLSRTIPFFMGYCEDDVDKAMKTIRSNIQVFKNYKDIDLTEKIEVSITEQQLDVLERISRYIGRINADSTFFRSYKNLIALTKAHALVRGFQVVSEKDIDFVRALIPFWFAPRGNDCEYYILKTFFEKHEEVKQIQSIKDELGEMYDVRTVDKYIFGLINKKILEHEGEQVRLKI